MASLFVIRGRDQGMRYDLEDAVMGLGRDNTNAIQLHDTEVSRQHAEVRRDGHRLLLIDLQSSNGCFVNEKRVERHTLRSGDRVQLGCTLMIFTGSEDETASHEAARVDIIGADLAQSNSRIVQSISQAEGSRIFEEPTLMESPWLARARSNLQVMYRTALAVSHTLDIDQLLRRIMDLIFEWVEADRGCVMLVDPETNELTPAVRRDRGDEPDQQNILISRTILDYVMEHTEGVLTSDAKEDARWEAAGSIVNQGVREAICVPMQGRYDVVGIIYIDTFTPPGRSLVGRAPNRFTEDHLKLMVAIGHQAALAVEDTSYYSAMVQAERLAAIGQTIATLSHHIKNILQGIRGGSYLIEEGLKNGESEIVRRGWSIVDKNQEKISNLVMDMLTFSKERDPVMEPAQLNSVTSDVVELMVVRARDLGVELTWRPASDMPTLCFDADAMHRAILNVVSNAIDACEGVDQAEVVVTSEHTAGERPAARVIVADNGGGISPDDIRKIFSVFESRKGSRGTGLGLPVSQKILQEHDGDVLVESSPGAGSRFVLEFPAVFSKSPTGDTLHGG